MVILSRKLAVMGHPVLRFDFKGCGESGGDWKEKRISDLIEDLKEVSHSLERLAPGLQQIWIGFRMGATLALLVGEGRALATLIGVAPLWKGKVEERHWRMRAKIRRELTLPTASSQTVFGANSPIEVDGQVIGAAFLEDLKGLDLMAQLKPVSFPVHVLGISPFGDPSAEKERCQKGLGERAQAAWISMDPFWDRLEETNVSLLVDHLLKILG
jgi:pimeloyl-ACP methyl ester carboxylesterase